ncbi:MAG TPA: VWA domain-containing protein [Vicinamibacterales bacterium]|nr:VWA domain-containing protein [Vicinamibacterales bacterium]
MKRRLQLGLALAAVAAAVALSAQQPQQPTFRGGTNVVRVDMYAMRDGKMVDDLKAAEVEVTEDGVKQTIESFERVVVRPPVSQDLRAEPNSVEESRQMAADPRARIFVIFLDTYQTSFVNAARMRSAVQQFVDRVVGQDDLVAVMTPEMSVKDIALGRRTSVITGMLDTDNWGRRGRFTDNDPIEDEWEKCYVFEDKTIFPRMKARRREKMALDALDDLVVHLGGLRDERKAVLAVSEGWLQYARDSTLAAPLKAIENGAIPLAGPRLIQRGARGEQVEVAGLAKCEADRAALAEMDNTNRLMDIGERANRVNVSFYPVGAQGLAVFDSDIGPDQPPPIEVDARNLSRKIQGLRYLADMTDGVAIVNTNNVAPLLRKVVDDMSSYYLLTYSSTNSKLDGKFRSIGVRVSRAGVQTRARRGYRALRPEEVTTTLSGSAAAPSSLPPAQTAVLAALNTMAFNPRAELRLRASAYALPAGQGAFWLVGTLDDTTRRAPEWGKGATADVAVRAGDGQTVLSAAVPLGADGGFAVQVPETGGLAAGDYTIRVRAKGGAGATIDETARVTIAAQSPTIGEPVVWRRRPATGLTYFRTADPRASRTDRLRFELSTAATAAPSATLLDRTGQPIAVPVQVTTRDENGTHWIVLDATIAPLAPGDYAIEVKAGDAIRTTAFRVVP